MEKNEFKEMDDFVNMLINEGAKKGSPFYVNLKNKTMKKENYEFICPVNYLPYIFNADIDNVTDDEIDRIEDVLSDYSSLSIKDERPFFSYQNDFNKFGCDCVILIALKND